MLFNENMDGQPIDNYRKQKLSKIGWHEAAHYIVARVLGFEVGTISLEVTHIYDGHNASSEIILYSGLKDLGEVEEYLKNRIMVLYAGVLGESLVNGKINDTYAVEELKRGGVNDYAKCRELLKVLNNIVYPNAEGDEIQINLSKINDEIWSRVVQIVEEEHEMIVGLGNRLVADIKLVGQKVELSSDTINDFTAIKKRFGNSILDGDI